MTASIGAVGFTMEGGGPSGIVTRDVVVSTGATVLSVETTGAVVDVVVLAIATGASAITSVLRATEEVRKTNPTPTLSTINAPPTMSARRGLACSETEWRTGFSKK